MSTFTFGNDIRRFHRIQLLGKGAYGKVYKARDSLNNTFVALKKSLISMDEEGIPTSTMREICLLRQLSHPGVVSLLDVIMTDSSLYLIFELLDQDLGTFLSSLDNLLSEEQAKRFLLQILKALYFCHSRRIIHRDLKPQNLLLDANLNIKLADFGLSRIFQIPMRPSTTSVQTLWYRAPEILLGCTTYTTAIDIWSIGCIFAEMVAGVPLFPGTSEHNQLYAIFRIMGTPNEENWSGVGSLPRYSTDFPKWSTILMKNLFPRIAPEGQDLLEKMLSMDPNKRISAYDCLQHPYFQGMN
ncbi:CDK3_1 [Blepharisma stoltei]|uniref:Cyclin-dependent kinase 2 homolog n=1 Tax=Blepharisma stoltei TaxID=1481888 RepID=A0AAU9IV36_9CILI|nr:unnamed protein product [Blepharisma stoltei]